MLSATDGWIGPNVCMHVRNKTLEKQKWNEKSHLGSIFQKTPNCFSVLPHSIESNNQQRIIETFCRLLAKKFLKSILQKAFPHE